MIARMWKPCTPGKSHGPDPCPPFAYGPMLSRKKKNLAYEQIVECEETRLGNIGQRAVLAQQLATTQVLRTSRGARAYPRTPWALEKTWSLSVLELT